MSPKQRMYFLVLVLWTFVFISIFLFIHQGEICLITFMNKYNIESAFQLIRGLNKLMISSRVACQVSVELTVVFLGPVCLQQVMCMLYLNAGKQSLFDGGGQLHTLYEQFQNYKTFCLLPVVLTLIENLLNTIPFSPKKSAMTKDGNIYYTYCCSHF